MFVPQSERFVGVWVFLQEPPQHAGIAEIGQHCPVAGEYKVLGIVHSERSCLHLSFEEGDSSPVIRLKGGAEVEAEVALSSQRFTSDDAHDVGVVAEELEAGLQDAVDQGPAG